MKTIYPHIALLVCCLVPVINVHGQLRLLDQYAKPYEIKAGAFNGYAGYEFSDMELVHRGGSFVIKQLNGSVRYYTYQDTSTVATEYSFRFFKGPKEEIPVVIMMDVASDHSMGQNLFLLRDKQVENAGFLRYAADDFNFSSLALHAIFSYENGNILLTFDDADIIDFERETVVQGNTIRFQIGNDYIKRID